MIPSFIITGFFFGILLLGISFMAFDQIIKLPNNNWFDVGVIIFSYGGLLALIFLTIGSWYLFVVGWIEYD